MGCLAILLLSFSYSSLLAQCPTGSSGSITISSDCTIPAGANYTISGDLTLNANLTLGAGATLTVTGSITNSYVGSITTRTISGGTINVTTESLGDNLILNLSGTSLNVTNGFTINYRAGLTMTNSSMSIGGALTDNSGQGPITVNNSTLAIGGNFSVGDNAPVTITNSSVVTVGNNYSNGNSVHFTLTNSSFSTVGTVSINQFGDYDLTNSTFTSGGSMTTHNSVDIDMDNSDLNITSGNLLVGGYASVTMVNGSELNVYDGNLQTEDQADIYADASDIYVDGDFNNDYFADLDLLNGSSMVVTGDFNNGINPYGGTVNSGSVNVDGSDLTIGGTLTSYNYSDITVDGGGSIAVGEDVINGPDSPTTITVTDGTFSYGGTLTDPSGGVSSGSGDLACTDGCCGSGCAALPVELLSFSISKINTEYVLDWETASEKNNDYFSIERSFDGLNYQLMDRVGGAGTCKEKHSYSWSEINQLGLVYYRLSQTDFDGSTEILAVKALNLEDEFSNLIIYPNPVASASMVYINGADVENISLLDINGRMILTISGSTSGFRLPVDIKPGMYFLQLTIAERAVTERIQVK